MTSVLSALHDCAYTTVILKAQLPYKKGQCRSVIVSKASRNIQTVQSSQQKFYMRVRNMKDTPQKCLILVKEIDKHPKIK